MVDGGVDVEVWGCIDLCVHVCVLVCMVCVCRWVCIMVWWMGV